MSFEYVSVEEAIGRGGLRMVVVGDVPSLWGEAAKGLLHIKRIPWLAMRLVYDSERSKQWAGQRSGPVAIYEKERPRSGWAEILLLAERLVPAPATVARRPGRARARVRAGARDLRRRRPGLDATAAAGAGRVAGQRRLRAQGRGLPGRPHAEPVHEVVVAAYR